MRTRKSWMIGLALLATPLAAQMGGGGGMGGMGGGGMGGGGMGDGGGRHGGPPKGGEESGHTGPRRPSEMKPIPRDRFDKVVTAMFKSADLNHDGLVTLAELQSVVGARLDAAIRDRFRAIDRNHDGHIDADEFTAWQKGLGSLAQSDCAASVREGQIFAEIVGPELGDGERDEALSTAIEPLSAMVIVKANIHYGPGVTLADLLAYEDKRFADADRNHDGFLEQDEISALQRGTGNGPRPRGTLPEMSGRGPGPGGSASDQ